MACRDAVPLGWSGDWEKIAADRTSLPPMLFVVFGLWPSAAIVIGCAQTMDISLCLLAALLSCAVVVLSGVLCRKSAGNHIALLALGCAIGCALGFGYAANLHAAQEDVEAAASGDYEFTIVEDPQAGDFGDSCIAETHLENGRLVRVRINLPDDADLACWDKFETYCRIKPYSEQAAVYYWKKGCAGSATIHSLNRHASSSIVSGLGWVRRCGLNLFADVPGDGVALLRALVFGSRESLFTRDFYGDVKAAGLAHLVAVSGSHLAVMVAFLAMLLGAVRCPRRFSIVIQAAFIVGYVVFTGAPHSAIRAAIMSVCAVGAFFAKRRASSLSALSLCIVLLVAINPGLALSVSFALSSSAVLGIVLFATYIAGWFDALLRGHARFASQTFGMTCAANMFTIPISISMFGQFSIVSPLANVIVTPMFPLMCVGSMVCTVVSLAIPACAPMLTVVAVSALQVVCDIITLCAHIPYACIPASGDIIVLCAITTVVAVTIWNTRPKPTPTRAVGILMALVVGVFAVIALLPGLHTDEIIMVDVGQGDAFIIRSGSRAVLIDTGTNDSMILEGLARHDIRTLDAVIITHPDDDHCGSLPAVLDVVQVSRICVSSDMLECTGETSAKLRAQMEGHVVQGLVWGDTVVFGDYRCRMVWPKRYVDEGGNADSLVLVVDADCDSDGARDWRALFCGDAEKDVIGELVSDAMVTDVDIYKVGHHGSKNAIDDALAKDLHPRVGLVSVGAGNRYGHPAASTMDALRTCGTYILRTDESGDVVCKLSADALEVTTLR